MLKGQARFDVAHDKTPALLGRRRQPESDRDRNRLQHRHGRPKVLVTLIEGHVVVLDENDGTTAMPAVPGRAPSNCGPASSWPPTPAAPPEIVPANIRKVTAWTIGQIMFDDEPLSSVVERVNRYGGTQIVITDPGSAP